MNTYLINRQIGKNYIRLKRALHGVEGALFFYKKTLAKGALLCQLPQPFVAVSDHTAPQGHRCFLAAHPFARVFQKSASILIQKCATITG